MDAIAGRALPSRLRTVRVPPVAGEPLLALAAVAVIDLAITIAPEPSDRPVDALAYGLGTMMGLLLLARRRRPLAVLVVTSAVLVVYYTFYPGFSPAVPLAVALYSAVVAGWLRTGVAVSAFFVVTGMVMRGFTDTEPPLTAFVSMTEIAAELAVIVMLGHVVRVRRIRLAEAAERVRLVEADREAAAARRVAAERLRIARELHDVLGHTTTLIGVQAQVVADALEEDPARARPALEAIRSASREAMTELKATVELLRDDGVAPRAPTPGLDQLGELCESARRGGLRVETSIEGTSPELPVAVELAAYRIVQESLTNVVRHSGAASVVVTVACRPDGLMVDVVDDGAARDAATFEAGRGIAGMAERAAGLGGSVLAGPEPGGGFRVHADLPVPEPVR